MKIATLTYQRHDNYGAMLQCYALQRKLKNYGVETDVIDYICDVSVRPFSIKSLKVKGIKRYITGIIGAITRLPRAKSFTDFRKLIDMTKTVTDKNISQIGASYDGYIVGSDNVWNSDITGLDERYFLSFVADKRRRASYAASFGSSNIREAQRDTYKQMLADFAVLSCREKSGAMLIENLTEKRAEIVCDPTMLLTKKEWSALAKNPRKRKPYLLAYQMVPSLAFVKFVNKVAKAKKLKVVFIPFPYGLIKCTSKLSIGPLEWLGLFEKADYIVTDSFHGCTFSIIFNKQFVVRISQLGERIDNLLSLLKIRERVVNTAEEALALQTIDYTPVNATLDEFKFKSETYLQNLISYFSELPSNGIVDSSRCTGCMVCSTACSRNAIETTRDDLGFLYPKINLQLCINCQACERVCESLVTSRVAVDGYLRKYYAAINKDKDIVRKSGSGGMFYALAEAIVNIGGTVYGAAYQNGFVITHERADNLKMLSRIMGTKYTQSSIIHIYDSIASDIENDKNVMFVGTPCQCAAIKIYLKHNKINDEKLYIVDIFCHGVFSPQIWSEYINFLETKYKEHIIFVSFRDKDKGWRNKYLKIITETTDISDYCNNHASVLRLYEQNISLRESCYQCPYMCLERVGDLSIGDFWGIERVAPKMDRNTGVSAVIVSTSKGLQLIDCIRNKVLLTEFHEENMLQQVLREPTKKHPQRDRFIVDYTNGGIEKILEKYGQVNGILKLKRDFIIPILYKLKIAGLASKLLHKSND